MRDIAAADRPRVAAVADSGPLMPAPRGGSTDEYPSLPLHEKIPRPPGAWTGPTAW